MFTVRTRIAPSPTGPLHIGTARTALFNYLFVKKHGGVFVLRIEDTDLERSDQKYETDIVESLKWLGIAYDEGPDVGGPHGPYRQSERLESYKKYLEKLLADGNAFYCFHTEAELEAERERLLTEKKPPIHVCEYRDFDPIQADKFLKEKPEHIIRFKTPAGRKIAFTDLIRGEISFESDLLGDFSLAKDLTVPLYNYAVVVDDYEMKISHVIRGEDHISNTPKQMLIQDSLGFPRPEYAHLPLILGPDRAKLSKRHGATSISEYRALGYLPEALVNFMALLGWNPGTDREVFSLPELIEAFDIRGVQKPGAVSNIEKLDWMNGEYMRTYNSEKLFDAVKPFLPKNHGEYPEKYNRAVLELEKPRLKKLSELKGKIDYFYGFMPDYYGDTSPQLGWKNMTLEAVRDSLEHSHTLIGAIPEEEFTKEQLEEYFFKEIGKGDKGELLWPLRVALTGLKASPGPFEIMEVFAILGERGKEMIKSRIGAAIAATRKLA